MNVKFSVFVICIEAIIYLLLYNLHGCTFNLSFTNNAKLTLTVFLIIRYFFKFLNFLVTHQYLVNTYIVKVIFNWS